MFATLLGGLPRPVLDGTPLRDPATVADPALRAELEVEIVREAISIQEASGLEPVTDGGDPALPGDAVGRYVTAAAVANVAVKQALVGPWTSGGDPTALAAAVDELVAVGCPLVEVHEPAAVGLAGPDDVVAFHRVHRRFVESIGATNVHLSLALLGGNVDGLGPVLFDLPYASYACDLRRGPDNWRLIVDAPGGRGIVVGAVGVEADSDDSLELLVWAAHYAASTLGRGLDRVGIGTAGSLAGLPWDVARAKVERLGEAGRIAAHETFAEIAPHLDPRAVGMKSAAFGRYVPPASRSRRPGS